MWSSGRRPRRPLSLVIALVALIALVAACGDDTDDATGADDATTSTVEAGDTTTTADDDPEVEGTTESADDGTTTSTVDDVAGDVQSQLVAELRDRGLTSLATALQGVDVDDLVDTGEFTFFAPDDEAFTTIDAEELADLVGDPELLIDTLRNHLVDERITGSDLYERDQLESRLGETLSVESDGATVTVGGATVTEADIGVGDAGVVHVVDALILPG